MSFINDFLDQYFGDYMPDKKVSAFDEQILLKHRNYINNPFKPPKSILDDNCAAKAVLVSVTSYAMGLAFGAFIHMNHYEMNAYELKGGTRTQMKTTMRDYRTKIHGTARGFTMFGLLFAVYDCQIEKMRGVTDEWNCFFAGGGTMMTLALDSGMKPRGLMMTGFFGGCFAVAMEHMMEGVF